MQIAFVLPSDRISGGSFVVYEHGLRLQRMGHDVRIVFRSDDRHPGPSSLLDFDLSAISWNEARAIRFDVVIATWWETALEIYQIPSATYAYFVQSDERRFYSAENTLDVALVALTYELPIPVITEARWIREMFRREFNKEAALAPNGVSLDVFFPDQPIAPKESRLRVLVEGPGSVAYKRVGLCFEVLSQVPDVEVWLVSTDGHVDEKWSFDRVFPPQSRAQMRAIYSSCDVLLKLSTVEGFFCPPLEMMACGGTVVVSRVTGHEEFVRHDENGLIVDLDDTAAAVAALVKLRGDPDLLARLKSAGFATAQAMTWEKSTPAFEQFLRETLEKGSPANLGFPSLPSIVAQLSRAVTTNKTSVAQQFDSLHLSFLTQTEARDQLHVLDQQFRALDSRMLPRQEFETQLVELDKQFRQLALVLRAEFAASTTTLQTEIRRLSEELRALQLDRERGLLDRMRRYVSRMALLLSGTKRC